MQLTGAWIRGCLFFLAIFFAATFGQDFSPEMQAEANRRMEFQRNWNGRVNSPGASMEGVLVERQSVGKNVWVMAYDLKTKGLPTDQGYELFMIPTMASRAEEIQSNGDVQLDNKDGRVMSGPGDPFRLIVPDPAAGEPYRFSVISKDGKHKAFATILPNPIEGSDHGCKVNVIRLMRNFELAFIGGTGFPPNTPIAGHGNSEGEIHDFTLTADANGYFDAGVLPFKRGKSKGKMEIRFTTPQCAPKIAFKWGSTEDGQPYQ